MELQIKQENYKQLVQCIYLGNLVINEYRKAGEEKKEYADLLEDVLLQIVKSMPKTELNFEFKAIPYKKTEDNMLSDLCDRIEDSINEFYKEYRNCLFDEMLAEKLKSN
ncbi:MAG: hypothetical protein K2I46_02900 [Clostridia bacterium]|nr:hypothetical protein [Clostridia bacterium]MDE6471564.1 hypothetical protein [Clostridia bacterium]